MLDLGRRISFGSYLFVPRSRRQLGALGRGLASLTDETPASGATIFVGRTRGREEKNAKGKCKRRFSLFRQDKHPADVVDRAFVGHRISQVGEKHFGASAAVGTGYFEGDAEDNHVYQVLYFPNDAEPTWAAFKANIGRIGEALARDLCQDSVLLVFDDGDRRTLRFAEWEP